MESLNLSELDLLMRAQKIQGDAALEAMDYSKLCALSELNRIPCSLPLGAMHRWRSLILCYLLCKTSFTLHTRLQKTTPFF